MKLLLDTNILLRFLFAPRKLPRAAVRRIERARAVYVSAISIFEIAIKARSTSSRSTMKNSKPG